MAVKLHQPGYDHARKLIESGKVVRDERDDWSEHQPDTDAENRFIDRHGLTEFGHWHLAVDDAEGERKGRYKFPYGDLSKAHRCAVITAESRAGQYKHAEVEKAAKRLLDLIDKKD